MTPYIHTDFVSIKQKFICHQFVTGKPFPSSAPISPIPWFNIPSTIQSKPQAVAQSPVERISPHLGDPLPYFTQEVVFQAREGIPGESAPQLLPQSPTVVSPAHHARPRRYKTTH